MVKCIFIENIPSSTWIPKSLPLLQTFRSLGTLRQVCCIDTAGGCCDNACTMMLFIEIRERENYKK